MRANRETEEEEGQPLACSAHRCFIYRPLSWNWGKEEEGRGAAAAVVVVVVAAVVVARLIGYAKVSH